MDGIRQARETAKQLSQEPLSHIYWMNIADRDMPFLAIVEHTNFVGPENYGGNHIVYISNYLEPGHEYFNLSEDQLWALFEPALKKINPQFGPEWVTGRWLFKGPYAQPIITTEYRDKKPDHRTPVDGLYQNGSCTHPGGSVSGLPGRNCAQVLLGDLGSSLEEAIASGGRVSR